MAPTAPDEAKLAHAAELLNAKNWPIPRWHAATKPNKIQTYEEYFTFQLRARYTELENDFRAILGNFPNDADLITATRITEVLHYVRGTLEQEATELLTISSSLDLVERYMVWLYPDWLAKARTGSLLLKLDIVPVGHRSHLIKRLTEVSKADRESYRGQLRSVLHDTIGTINSHVIQERISIGLQVNRLKMLRFWGLIILLTFFALSPLATDLSKIRGWPSETISELVKLPWWLYPWLNALAMMALGAVGGFLSGLLQVQHTSITFTKYLENILKLELRPIVGALVSLILYALLSWQVLPGITINNIGSYFLIAFLSGFSERYFLQLLKTDPEKTNAQTDEAELTDKQSRQE